MLFNNLTTQRKASLIVKNSNFYIEIAKFVQAYTTIVKNPNEFLSEIGEQLIDQKKQHLTWDQLVKIMQTCDLGFSGVPSKMDLIVYYNYALEMGSVTALEKRIASVDEVAEAQKHYYNFVDEAKTTAEEEYQKQKKIYEARLREMGYVDGKISVAKAKNWTSAIMMFFSIVIGMIGIVGFFVNNAIVSTIGKIIPVWEPQYIGSIIMVLLMFLLFALFNKLYIGSKYEYTKLKQASATIFAKEDEMLAKQQILKKKLDEVSKDYSIVIKEINDKNKRFDVKENIDKLKATNKFYLKLCETEQLSEISEKTAIEVKAAEEDFAPIKLTKEQEENVRDVKKEVIGLQGQLDTEAYNEKFEKSTKAKKEEDQNVQSENEEVDEDTKQKLDEQKREQERKSFNESMDYVKDLLGLSDDNSAKEK